MMSPEMERVLASAPETKCLEFGAGTLERTTAVFDRCFKERTPLVVADATTFEIAGQNVLAQLQQRGYPSADHFLFRNPDFYADESSVGTLEQTLRKNPGLIPVAVGSGTINDVAKLAAHRSERRYLSIATAASMDGYTAFGASITRRGSKQTFSCAAPLAVIVDLGLIQAAPPRLNAAGYADLLAKVTAGADWILADALEVEPIHSKAWELVQPPLRSALSNPAGIRAGEASSVEALTAGLILSGFAMQLASSSRPASGAEHQFSHLWDMQHHTHLGATLLHGFKVGLGTLVVAALYQFLLDQPLESLSVEPCCEQWPAPDGLERSIRDRFQEADLANVALKESRAKYLDAVSLRAQLAKLRETWPGVRLRLQNQLLPCEQVRLMLQQAGAPTQPEELGLSRRRLRESIWAAYYIRRRFTVLDVLVRAGLLENALDHLFGAKGPWPISKSVSES